MHVNDLPAETLIEIFGQAKSSAPFDVGGSTVIISISQVCGTWRIIALDSPTLWNDIRLSSRSSLFKFDQLSARSKDSLISVAIDCRTSTSSPTKLIHYWTLFNGLLVQRDRICALNVIAPIHILSLLSRVLMQTFSRLQCLNVEQEFAPNLAPDSRVVDKVPPWKLESLSILRLKSLALTAITTMHLPYDLQELYIKESGFSEFSLPGKPPTYFDKLNKLSIVSSPLPLFSGPPTHTQIVSLTLSKLRTADNSPGNLAHFLFTFRMPALEHLTIDSLHGYLWDEFVDRLVDAEYPALRSVTFQSITLAGMDEARLRAFASISKLRLIDVETQPILRILESNPRTCPQVREIDVGGGRRLGISGRG
ncbi:hypothetical protein B0H11DRAFT_1149707 [Mycena galericulata]|nr:hypothetical protein B0H11DRAFT_1149707 [Mycena galericulata]